MFEKILVPLDGSKLAEIALPYAENLAGTLDSEIHLIHISEEGHAQYEHMHELYMGKMVEAVKQGAQLYPTLRGREPVEVKSVILQGDPAEQIVDYADRENISVINMATHGRSGVARWVLGSVANKVIEAAKCPIALFRAERPLTPSSGEPIVVRYLVPLDGSKESESIIPYVEELGSKVGGEVIILYVVQPGSSKATTLYEIGFPYTKSQVEDVGAEAEAYIENVCRVLEGKGIKARCEVRFGAAAEEILRLASEIDPHIVAMASHARSFFGRLAMGSTAEKVLHGGTSPLLLVKA